VPWGKFSILARKVTSPGYYTPIAPIAKSKPRATRVVGSVITQISHHVWSLWWTAGTQCLPGCGKTRRHGHSEEPQAVLSLAKEESRIALKKLRARFFAALCRNSTRNSLEFSRCSADLFFRSAARPRLIRKIRGPKKQVRATLPRPEFRPILGQVQGCQCSEDNHPGARRATPPESGGELLSAFVASKALSASVRLDR